MNEPENSAISGPSELETLDYLRGVKSSTCLLLPNTPSPTPLDFKHPLSEEVVDAPFLALNDEPSMGNLQNLETNLLDVSAGDSSSSGDSNSVVQDPVSAQLINNISMLDYQTLSKNGDLIMGQVEDCKLKGGVLNGTNRKLPGFVNWNWIVIRKVLLWMVLSSLVACLGAIIAMVVTIPKKCNPDLPWYQGKVFYEVFPATFKDSDNDGMGDLKGLTKKLDYIHALGASAIRLNSIFASSHYPDNYHNPTSLEKIDRSIGVMKDFQNLVDTLHDRDMHLILDLPVISMVNSVLVPNSTHSIYIANNTIVRHIDPTSAALKFWAQAQKVDGFYMKNLEKHVDDVHFERSLQVWKDIIGSDRILIASEQAYLKAKGSGLNVLLSRVDLIDVNLDLKDGLKGLKRRIMKLIDSEEDEGGHLWSRPHFPWIHWNIGNIESERISTKNTNLTLVLTALQTVLPGTISIFYGDEIGLFGQSKNQVETDYKEHEHTHNLLTMKFSESDKHTTNGVILPWGQQPVSEPKYHYIEAIQSFTRVRLSTPTIYLRGMYKEGNLLKNAAVRETEEKLVVIERWYPRRNTCVFMANFGSLAITTDLTTMFYGGTVVAGTNASLIGQVLYLENITFPPYSAIILKLEK